MSVDIAPPSKESVTDHLVPSNAGWSPAQRLVERIALLAGCNGMIAFTLMPLRALSGDPVLVTDGNRRLGEAVEAAHERAATDRNGARAVGMGP